MNVYDLVIIGAGPAGLSAGIYAGRAMLKTIILEKGPEGGQIVQTAEIENYPGSPGEESGFSLIERMSTQVRNFGVERVFDEVTAVSLTGEIKEIIGRKATYQAKAVIIAGGAQAKKLGCKGEMDFLGKGVSHCATCDAPFFSGLEVFVVGGGDAALEEALFLTKFVKKVTVIHRRKTLRAAKSIQEQAVQHDKIHFLYDTVINEIKGTDLIESIVLENVNDGSLTEIKADSDDGTFGIFIFAGYDPLTDLYQGQLEMSKAGYLITDEEMRTNVNGVFAAGDVREKSVRQVVTATADGAIAAVQAGKYIETLEEHQSRK